MARTVQLITIRPLKAGRRTVAPTSSFTRIPAFKVYVRSLYNPQRCLASDQANLGDRKLEHDRAALVCADALGDPAPVCAAPALGRVAGIWQALDGERSSRKCRSKLVENCPGICMVYRDR